MDTVLAWLAVIASLTAVALLIASFIPSISGSRVRWWSASVLAVAATFGINAVRELIYVDGHDWLVSAAIATVFLVVGATMLSPTRTDPKDAIEDRTAKSS